MSQLRAAAIVATLVLISTLIILTGTVHHPKKLASHQLHPTPVTTYGHRDIRMVRASRSQVARRKLHLSQLRYFRHHRPAPTPPVTPTVTPSYFAGATVWDSLAECESGGNWASTSGGFEGGVQFLNSTWLSYGGGRFASHAYLATREEQIEVAKRLQVASGWGQWPYCAHKLGLI